MHTLHSDTEVWGPYRPDRIAERIHVVAYGSFCGPGSPPVVVPSEIESRASGVAMGRLDIWPAGAVTGHEVRDLVLSSGLDLVVVRYPTQDVLTAATVRGRDVSAWQADTLVYFECRTDAAEPTPDFIELGASDFTLCTELITSIFRGYTNHYAANPYLSTIDLTAAYAEWATSCLSDGTSSTLLLTDSLGRPIGLCTVDEKADDYDEIALTGIVPTERRRGNSEILLRRTLQRSARRGKANVVTSTQASNIASMRALCRVGFLPKLTLNTLHVMRSASFSP